MAIFIKEDQEYLTIDAFYSFPENERTGCVKYDSGTKHWFKNGKFHREDGPARELANGDKEYWLNDKHYSYTEWYAIVNKLEKFI